MKPQSLSDSLSTMQRIHRTESDASMQSKQPSNLNTSISQADSLASKNDLAILREIFTNTIEEQVKLIMESIIRAENMMVLFLYSDLLYRVLVSHNNSQFMHQPLVSLLRIAKMKTDEYVNHLRDMIKEYKVNKKEKIGLLRYVVVVV